MHNAYVVTGKMEDARTVKLDEELPLTVSQVRLTVVPTHVNGVAIRDRSYTEVLEEIHAGQRARGHVPPTKEEVDAYIEAERASWD